MTGFPFGQSCLLGSCLPGDSVQTSMTMSLWFPSTGVTDLHYQKLRLVYTSLLHPGWNNSPVSWVVGKGFHNTGCLMDGQCSLQEKINQKLLLTKELWHSNAGRGLWGCRVGGQGTKRADIRKIHLWQSGFQLIKQRKTSFSEDNPIGSTCKIFAATFCLLELQLKAI